MPADPAAPPAWTVQALLRATADLFAKKGIETGRLDAELLLAHVLKCDRINLIARYYDQPTDEERTEYRGLVKRRADRWPTAYLIGRREFYLLPFEVSPAVLVPRPDTETLVLEAIEAAKGTPTAAALDLGTGSGCIAVSLAKQCKGMTVTAADVSPDALEVAKKNAAKHGVADRVTFRPGDLFAAVPAGSTFDLIVSNPPYITPTELAELAPEVRDHEPRLALDGGPDGLAFYRRIASEAGRFLKPGGWLLVEVGHTQSSAVEGLFASGPGLTFVRTVKDRAGVPRVVIGRRA